MTIISPRDLGQRLGVSVRWVYAHVHELCGKRIGAKVFFTEEALERIYSGVSEQNLALANRPAANKPYTRPDTDRRAGGEDDRDPDRHRYRKFLQSVIERDKEPANAKTKGAETTDKEDRHGFRKLLESSRKRKE
jgi:hypothetical protein